jgi:hypothetical protein
MTTRVVVVYARSFFCFSEQDGHNNHLGVTTCNDNGDILPSFKNTEKDGHFYKCQSIK